MSAEGKLAGVVGWPVEHSLSPKLHGYWIEKAGIDAAYVAVPVMPGDVREAFDVLVKHGFSGWNITVPHKEEALTLMDETDQLARAIGAVNTVLVKPDGTLFGTNTDAYGFSANLKEKLGSLEDIKTHALVLGAGGAARAVAYALKSEGFKRVTITNRTRERAEAVAAATGCEVADWASRNALLPDITLLVNTTTLGMTGQPQLDIDVSRLPKHAAVTDIVYKPLMTPLLASAKLRGLRIVTGIGMLIHQAVPGFRAWFGVTPQVDAGLEEMLLS